MSFDIQTRNWYNERVYANVLGRMLWDFQGTQLRGLFPERTGLVGEAQQIKILGRMYSTQPEETGTPIQYQQTPKSSRWFRPLPFFQHAELFTKEDEIYAAMSPMSGYTTATMNMFARDYDNMVLGRIGEIGGLLGKALVDGGTATVDFPTANELDASGALTWDILGDIKRRFGYLGNSRKIYGLVTEDGMNQIVDNGPAFFSAGGTVRRWGQADEVEASRVLNGEVGTIRGITFRMVNRDQLIAQNNPYYVDPSSGDELGLAPDDTNYAVFCTEDALEVGVWADMQLNVDRIPQVNGVDPYQMKTTYIFGSGRAIDQGVLRVEHEVSFT